MADRRVTLFSSDARPQYAEDILNVLASPVGAHYQFRYEAKYLPQEVKDWFQEDCENIKIDALVAFRSSTENTDGKFIVPIRFVSIVSVDKTLDFYVLKFQIGDYPVCTEIYSDFTKTKIEKRGQTYLGTLPQELKKLPVHSGFLNFVENGSQNNKSAWMNISRQLAKHATFSNKHFLRVGDVIRVKDNQNIKINSDGSIDVFENSYVNMNIDYYSEIFPDKPQIIQTVVDEGSIRLASPKEINIQSRYDSISVLMEMKHTTGETVTDVFVIYKEKNEEAVSINVPIRFMVHPQRFERFFSTMLTAIGAFSVAMPGLLKDIGSLQLKLLFAFFGACLVAYSMSKRR